MLSVTVVLKDIIFGYSHSLLLLFSVKLWASSVVLFCGILPLKFPKPSQPPTPSLAASVGLSTVYTEPHTSLLLPSLPLQFWTTGVGRLAHVVCHWYLGLFSCWAWNLLCDLQSLSHWGTSCSNAIFDRKAQYIRHESRGPGRFPDTNYCFLRQIHSSFPQASGLLGHCLKDSGFFIIIISFLFTILRKTNYQVICWKLIKYWAIIMLQK